MIWKASDKCIKLLKKLESKQMIGYPDQKGVPTAGYGHTGSDVKLGEQYTEEQVNAWLEEDLKKFYAEITALQRLNRIELTQDQFDGLLLLIYNWGATNFRGSKLRTGIMSDASNPLNAKEWIDIIKTGGKISRGLFKRRLIEIMVYYGLDTDILNHFKS